MCRLPFLLLAFTLLALTSACRNQPKHDYGPSFANKSQSLADEPEAPPPTKQEDTNVLAGSVRWAGSLDSATAEAQSMEGHQKILLLVTDGACAGCLKYEDDYFRSAAIAKEAEDRWLFVRGDITNDPGLLTKYKLAKTDLPLLILVSEDGNENGRIETVPSTAEVLAGILHDRF